jgi:tryptophan synthase beta chain
VSDEQADAAFREVARLEGIIPALETSHALHYAVHEDGAGSTMDLICCSGRGDKDLAEVLARGGN